ncbi:MAG: AI-2E family transporter [Erysipelotrichaceae bacterium]|nr:AI-2E family transporter [Erysipelotrichaceae bacterium]
MNKIFKDPESKKKIQILTLSGIFVATFIMLVFNFNNVASFLSNLFTALFSFVWGILFALIMYPIACKLEKVLPEKWKFKTKRFVSSLLSTLLLIVVIVVSVVVIIPSLATSITSLSNTVKAISSNPSVWINSIQNTLHLSDDIVRMIYSYSNQILQTVLNALQNIIPNILSATIATASALIKIIIGFIVCLYILNDRQKLAITFSKVASAYLNESQYNRGKKIGHLLLEKFTGFFGGKLLDSLIVGIICFVAMLFINSQYAALIAIVVGITNIVPFFGPFIGAIPCALILLFVDPLDSLIFIIMILILQQIDGNIIGPRIIGDSVGLSSLWIMFAIILGGAYFGFFGMLLGVPVFSAIYYIFKEIVDERLEEKNEEAE